MTSMNVTEEVLKVTVDRDRSIADGVTAGKYDWSNSQISEKNFSRSGKGTADTEIILIHFDKSMSTDNVLKELERRNMRPADLQELLAIGEQHPEKQRQFSIIALGSVWQRPDNFPLVSSLLRIGSDRTLYLFRLDVGWLDVCRFAAVRK